MSYVTKSDALRAVGPTQLLARCILLFFYGESSRGEKLVKRRG